MLIRFTLKALGIFLAYSPIIIPRGIAWIAGNLIYYLPTERRRTLLSNLQRAFPEKPRTWRRGVAKKSAKRFVEMALLSLAAPYFSETKIRNRFKLGPEATESLKPANNQPALLLPSHFALMEAATFIPLLYPGKCPQMGTLYRPFSVKAIETYIKDMRERFGMKLLSRKEGLNQAIQILKNGEVLCILFDQNSGPRGSLTTLFGRYASTTELPQIIAKKYKPKVSIMYPYRTGFWEATIHHDVLPEIDYSTPDCNLIFQSNEWLENKLKFDYTLCASWLWIHDRWKHQDHHQERFHINTKRNLIPETLRYQQLKELPKKTRYWFRMPNWLGDVIMTLPFLKIIRHVRPDVEITLIVKPQFIELLKKFNIADKYISLPNKKSLAYFLHFWKLSGRFPDMQLMFTNSFRGDLEAFLIGAPQRFGIQRPNKPKRRFITHPWVMPTDFDENCIHQIDLWKHLFTYHGLKEELDFAPFKINVTENQNQIGLICGTENSPEKRWPINKWIALIDKLKQNFPDIEINLLGTERDQIITQKIYTQIKSKNQVRDLAGQTNLIQFTNKLAQSSCIICNDTGGMHLANAIGTPVIALFGPTNLVRTGPIYAGSKTIIKPLSGMRDMNEITTEQVFSAYLNLKNQQASEKNEARKQEV